MPQNFHTKQAKKIGGLLYPIMVDVNQLNSKLILVNRNRDIGICLVRNLRTILRDLPLKSLMANVFHFLSTIVGKYEELNVNL